MSGAISDGDVAEADATLNQRIRSVENRLASRQRSVRVHAAGLHQNLRKKLGNPVSLLIALGAGFALGQFTRHKNMEVPPSGDLVPPRQSLFARLMEVLSLVSTIMALFPAKRGNPIPEAGDNGEIA